MRTNQNDLTSQKCPHFTAEKFAVVLIIQTHTNTHTEEHFDDRLEWWILKTLHFGERLSDSELFRCSLVKKPDRREEIFTAEPRKEKKNGITASTERVMERQKGGRKDPKIWTWVCSFWKMSLSVLWTNCSDIPFLHPSPIFASRSLCYIFTLLYNRSSVCERGTLNFPADFHDLLQFAVPPSLHLVWPFSIKVVRFSARTACKLPLSWVGQ